MSQCEYHRSKRTIQTNPSASLNPSMQENIQLPLFINGARHQFHNTSWDTSWQHTTTKNRHQNTFGSSSRCNSTNQCVAIFTTTRTHSISTDLWNLQESTKQVGATKWKNHHNNKTTEVQRNANLTPQHQAKQHPAPYSIPTGRTFPEYLRNKIGKL
jgi:hypothetical protein